MTGSDPLLLHVVVDAALEAGATRSRTAKRDALAGALAVASAAEAPVVVGLLTGAPRQGKIGIGPALAFGVEAAPSEGPILRVLDVDRALDQIAAVSGPGANARRRALLSELLGSATEAEQDHLRRLLVGELRHGALEGVVADAVAVAHGLPQTLVRRAAMFAGDLGVAAAAAGAFGREGLEAFGLEVGRPIQPMLASTSSSAGDAVVAFGRSSVEWKLDGIRVQVHRRGGEVLVVTRNLNDITSRVPSVVEAVRSLMLERCVLDGEMLWFADGRPAAFQDTAAFDDGADERSGALRCFFFDLLHLDGRDLVDAPLAVRASALAGSLPPHMVVPSLVTDDPAAAETFLAESIAAGHEGVVVKDLASPYLAGRRGTSWRKVKPVHTFDLVVLAAEWGHGRRRGRLSNIHLGARRGDEFVMVGKTFKGMTDVMLAWQTERFLELEEARESGLVRVRPEQVVEVAIDGVQRSTRYPGGIALRFARVVRYRDDKTASQVDPLDALLGLRPT